MKKMGRALPSIPRVWDVVDEVRRWWTTTVMQKCITRSTFARRVTIARWVLREAMESGEAHYDRGRSAANAEGGAFAERRVKLLRRLCGDQRRDTSSRVSSQTESHFPLEAWKKKSLSPEVTNLGRVFLVVAVMATS